MTKTAPLLLLLATLASCASTSRDSVARADSERTPAAIARRLADSVERRGDPNHMRVLVHFEPPADPDLALVTPELERELIAALSGRLHLYDSGLSATSKTFDADLSELVARLHVTHALVCETARKDGDVLLSLRLVEYESLRIVATSQGSFPVEVLTDSNRVALTREALPPLAPVVARPPADAELAAAAGPESLQVAALDGPPVRAARSYDDYRYVRTIPMEQVVPKSSPVMYPAATEEVAPVTSPVGTANVERVPEDPPPVTVTRAPVTQAPSRETPKHQRGPGFWRTKAIDKP